MTTTGQRLTVLSKQIVGLSTAPVAMNKVIGSVITTTAGRPVMRVPTMSINTSSAGILQQMPIQCHLSSKNVSKDVEKDSLKDAPKSEFYMVNNFIIL